MAKVSKSVFITAGILTAIVFSSGIMLGWYMDRNRVSILQSQINDLQVSFANIDLENSFYQTVANQSTLCQLYINRATKFSEEADKLGNLINNFKTINQFDKEDIDSLKEKYTVINLQFWLQVVNLKKNCEYNATTVLYFYKILECDECVAQGLVLDNMKKARPSELMIFAIDRDTNLGIVGLLKGVYNVTRVPFVVINERTGISGFRNETALRTHIQN